VREEMRWDGGDGEADPRERKKKLDENVVLVSFVLSVEITKSLITYIYIYIYIYNLYFELYINMYIHIYQA
jgi:hypothetical protein